jgi:hypothetical protein
VVGVGRAMQAQRAAECVGTLLDLFRRENEAGLPRGARREAVAHHLLDQSFELSVQLQRTDEVIRRDHFVVDAHDACHGHAPAAG